MVFHYIYFLLLFAKVGLCHSQDPWLTHLFQGKLVIPALLDVPTTSTFSFPSSANLATWTCCTSAQTCPICQSLSQGCCTFDPSSPCLHGLPLAPSLGLRHPVLPACGSLDSCTVILIQLWLGCDQHSTARGQIPQLLEGRVTRRKGASPERWGGDVFSHFYIFLIIQVVIYQVRALHWPLVNMASH